MLRPRLDKPNTTYGADFRDARRKSAFQQHVSADVHKLTHPKVCVGLVAVVAKSNYLCHGLKPGQDLSLRDLCCIRDLRQIIANANPAPCSSLIASVVRRTSRIDLHFAAPSKPSFASPIPH